MPRDSYIAWEIERDPQVQRTPKIIHCQIIVLYYCLLKADLNTFMCFEMTWQERLN